jgi:hypothetical protein
MSEDWRLTSDFHEEGNAHRATEKLEAKELEHDLRTSFHDRIVVSRDGAEVFCYAGSADQAQKAERLIRSLAETHGWRLDSKLDRWHPEEERWEGRQVSMPHSRGEHQAEHARLVETEREETRQEGYPEWEVRVQCRTHHDARRLAEQLSQEGVPCLRRWHYLLLGAPDEDSARQLAERLQAEAPSGATETVEMTGRAMLDMTGEHGINPFLVF